MNRKVEKERNRAVVLRDILGVYFSLPFLKVLCVIPSWVVFVCVYCQNRAWSLFSHYGWVLLV